MQAESFIVQRLIRGHHRGASSGVVGLAVGSVAIGLAVMILALAIVVGFKQQIRDKVVGFVAHIQIEPLSSSFSIEEIPFKPDEKLLDNLKTNPSIRSIQAVIQKPGIVKTTDHIQGVALRGVDEDYDWTYLRHYMVSGNVPDYTDSSQRNKVLISAELAQKLMVNTGEVLRMWFVSGDPPRARGRRFEVGGIYQTGLVEFDQQYVFGFIEHLRRLNNWEPGAVGSIELTLNDVAKLDQVYHQLYYSLPPELTATTVSERFPHIFDWLDLQDMNVLIIIVLMILVAGITMISTLLIIILERTSLIGILKTFGMPNFSVKKVFLFLSARIMIRGMLWGNLLAIAIMQLQLHLGLFRLPEESYYLTHVPIFFSLKHILLINMGAMTLWLISLLIPVRIITRITPARAISFA